MRPLWSSLPAAVRAAIEDLAGFAFVREASQAGGFSPGVASIVYGAHGERAFVKAVSSAVNDFTPTMHRREARMTVLLPDSVAAPSLLGTYDDGTWVALILEHIEGRPPSLPWSPVELKATLGVLDRLAEVTAPPGVPTFAEDHLQDFDGWRQLADNPPEDLTSWERRHLDRLATLEATWPEAAAGDQLVHLDVRHDNLLVRTDGSVVLVDWPWAQRGNAVFDVVGFAPSVALNGGPDPEQLLAQTVAGRMAEPETVTALVCAVAGLWQEARRRPAPDGMPTVRAFQAAHGDAAMTWLAHRTGWT